MPAKRSAAKPDPVKTVAAKRPAAPPAKKAPARAPKPPTVAPKKPAPPNATAASPVKKSARKAAPPKETPAGSSKGPSKGAPKAQNPVTANRTRVVIAMAVYEPQKDAIKAPFKEHGLKWNFLGEGKGLYKHPDGGIHCFTQFKDDGVHYTIWGANDKGVQEILGAWKSLLGPDGWAKATASGAEAQQKEEEAKESEAVRAWKLAQPQPRPGEPDFFLKKRLAEWEAKRPGS